MKSRNQVPNAVVLLLTLCFVTSRISAQGKSENQRDVVEWELATMLQCPNSEFTVVGKPKIIHCCYGQAVQFDGKEDALFLNTNPLIGLQAFTIEIVFRPDTNGSHEQRFLHIGEVKEERFLVELRVAQDSLWYLDAFLKSGDSGQVLVDSMKLHPMNSWHHGAFVVDHGALKTYINGELEMMGQIPFVPFSKGEASIGVRLNHVNWYKGAIYKIRITPAKVDPTQFLRYD